MRDDAPAANIKIAVLLLLWVIIVLSSMLLVYSQTTLFAIVLITIVAGLVCLFKYLFIRKIPT
jgi:uncharacterized membrane protein